MSLVLFKCRVFANFSAWPSHLARLACYFVVAVPSSLVIFLSCINVTLYNFWARIKIVVVVVVIIL